VRPTKPLPVALLEALQQELDNAIELGDFDSGLAAALPGHELPYDEWLRVYAPHACLIDSCGTSSQSMAMG